MVRVSGRLRPPKGQFRPLPVPQRRFFRTDRCHCSIAERTDHIMDTRTLDMDIWIFFIRRNYFVHSTGQGVCDSVTLLFPSNFQCLLRFSRQVADPLTCSKSWEMSCRTTRKARLICHMLRLPLFRVVRLLDHEDQSSACWILLDLVVSL